MTTLFIAFIISFVTALIMTRLMIPIAIKFGIVDQPGDYRKLHSKAIPAMGGPAILIAFITPISLLFLLPEHSTVSELLINRSDELIGIMVGAVITLVLGLIDDKYDIKARWKLSVQVIIAVIIFYCGLRIDEISNPFGESLSLGIFALPITILWVVACMNAVNLLDGIDGLAAGVSLFASLTVLLVSLQYHNILGAILMASISGATLGFLLLNFPPAKIFLGDSGSLLLGFLLASLSLAGTSRKAEAAVALFVPVIALGLPLFDTSMAILRRWYKRLPIDTPDRMHIHHVLVRMGYSQKRVILTLYAICVVLGGSALLIAFSRSEIVLLVIGSLAIMTSVSIRIFSGVRFRDIIRKLAADRVRNDQLRDYRAAIKQGQHEMKSATNNEDLWTICCKSFSLLELTSAEFFPNHKSYPELTPRSWNSVDTKEIKVNAWTLSLVIEHGGERMGVLMLDKFIIDKMVCLPSDIVELLEEFAGILSDQLASLINKTNLEKESSSK